MTKDNSVLSLEEIRIRLESVLENRLPKNLHSPLSDAMRYSTLNGGKRLRGMLVYASGIAFNAPMEALDHAASAVECIHSYSLIHDDLPAMDDDDLRRGKPSNHIQFDEATAILAGDALQALAFDTLSSARFGEHGENSIRPETQLKMVQLLAKASGSYGMVGGQILDMQSTNNSISLDELKDMHSLKTGALIQASTLLGVICSENANQSEFLLIKQFADYIGLAFQIVDDILDETSDTQTLGKRSGSDKTQGKSTYVLHMGVVQAQIEAKKLIDDALQCLDKISHNTALLEQLAKLVIHRIH